MNWKFLLVLLLHEWGGDLVQVSTMLWKVHIHFTHQYRARWCHQVSHQQYDVERPCHRESAVYPQLKAWWWWWFLCRLNERAGYIRRRQYGWFEKRVHLWLENNFISSERASAGMRWRTYSFVPIPRSQLATLDSNQSSTSLHPCDIARGICSNPFFFFIVIITRASIWECGVFKSSIRHRKQLAHLLQSNSKTGYNYSKLFIPLELFVMKSWTFFPSSRCRKLHETASIFIILKCPCREHLCRLNRKARALRFGWGCPSR